MVSTYQTLVQAEADLSKKADGIRGQLRTKREALRKNPEDEALTEEVSSLAGQYESVAAELDSVKTEIAEEEQHRERMRSAAKRRFEEESDDRETPRAEGKKADVSLGQFLQAVAQMSTPGGRYGATQAALEIAAAASGANTNAGADGGFLVRTDFSTTLLEAANEATVLAQRCTRIPIGGDADSIEAPYVENTSRANGSRFGGVQVYRAGEADSVTATRPKFEMFELRLEDLRGLAYATDRSLRDATSLEAIIRDSFRSEFSFKIDDEIVNGDGAGEMLGILNAGATVEVAKETGQAADTIVADNIVKMWARLYSRSRGNAVWFYNQDIEPQLFTLSQAVGTGGIPVYMPPNGLAAAPFATIMGRPAIAIEQASTLGDKGDIILADLSQYVIIDKDTIQSDSSMHVRFVNHEMTFRFNYRINGKPKWRTSLTPFKGSNAVSPFVTLAARA